MLHTLRGKISNITSLTLDKTLTLEGASADAKAVGDAIAKEKNEANAQTKNHTDSTTNPHKVTAEQVGLGKVDNTPDLEKPVSNAQAAAIKAVSEQAGEKAVTSQFSGTFLSSAWSEEVPHTQTIKVEGIFDENKPDDKPIVDLDLSDVAEPLPVIEAWGLVHRCTVGAEDNVTAYCYQDAPVADIPVVFKVVR